MNSFPFGAGILIGISALFISSCDRAPRQPLSLPGRDEVAVSGQARLSMSAFETLRASYPELSPENVVRLGLYSIWLKESHGTRPALQTKDASRWVRAFLPPQLPSEAQLEVEKDLKAKSRFSSLNALKKALDDAEIDSKIEFNPALVQEYGILPSNLRGNSG